ncbi:hypothetical protein [Myroides odoratus]|uniref:hypothetical protein n=1 Tax=Myroides odoratus TaxID=256 RepID=UPI00333F2ED5
MRTFFVLSIFILFLTKGYTQNENILDHLIGSWKFIELQDENGQSQTKAPIYFKNQLTYEIVNRPDYIFYEDGTYQSNWKTGAKENGTWTYDEKRNIINLSLQIAEDDAYFNHLLEHKVIKKHDNGLYYQIPVQRRILSLSDTKMVIADNGYNTLIYSREE